MKIFIIIVSCLVLSCNSVKDDNKTKKQMVVFSIYNNTKYEHALVDSLYRDTLFSEYSYVPGYLDPRSPDSLYIDLSSFNYPLKLTVYEMKGKVLDSIEFKDSADTEKQIVLYSGKNRSWLEAKSPYWEFRYELRTIETNGKYRFMKIYQRTDWTREKEWIRKNPDELDKLIQVTVSASPFI